MAHNNNKYSEFEERLSPDARKKLRPSNDILARRDAFTKKIDPSAKILEIGPYFRPAFTGDNVRYFDVFSTEVLIKNAQADPDPAVTPDTIPVMHFHDSNGDLSVVDETFDAVFSSHCIEHQPDLIGHLNQVANVLTPGGRYYVVAPDKRFCFDHMRAETSLGEIIQASREKRKRHSLTSIVDTAAFRTHNSPTRHWQGDHTDPGWQVEVAKRAKEAMSLYETAGNQYIDTHAWKFTPAVFLHLVDVLHELGLSQLQPVQVWQTPPFEFEFTAILKKS
jgi:SAM-dependent methyltransferase